jgi:hypothetical protein
VVEEGDSPSWAESLLPASRKCFLDRGIWSTGRICRYCSSRGWCSAQGPARVVWNHYRVVGCGGAVQYRWWGSCRDLITEVGLGRRGGVDCGPRLTHFLWSWLVSSAECRQGTKGAGRVCRSSVQVRYAGRVCRSSVYVECVRRVCTSSVYVEVCRCVVDRSLVDALKFDCLET